MAAVGAGSEGVAPGCAGGYEVLLVGVGDVVLVAGFAGFPADGASAVWGVTPDGFEAAIGLSV